MAFTNVINTCKFGVHISIPYEKTDDYNDTIPQKRTGVL